MKINVREFLGVLSSIRPGVGNQSIIFQEATHVVFDGLRATGYNGQLSVSHACMTDFKFSVPLDSFSNVLKAIPQEEVEILLQDGNLILNLDKGEVKILSSTGDMILPLIDSLKLDQLQEKDWILLPDDFKQGLELCMMSVSQDMTNSLLSSIYVNDSLLISSDDARVSEYKMKSRIGTSFLIPSFAVSELLSFDISHFCLADSWIHFRTKDQKIIFSSRTVIGDYYETDPVFDFQGVRFRLPKDFKSNLDLASVFAGKGGQLDNCIELLISKEKIEYRSTKNEGAVYAWSDVGANVEKPICLLINPIFFSKILEQPIVSIRCSDNRALFTFGSFRHVVMVYLKG